MKAKRLRRQRNHWRRDLIVTGWWSDMHHAGQPPVLVHVGDQVILTAIGRPYDPKRDAGRWDFMHRYPQRIIDECRDFDEICRKEGVPHSGPRLPAYVVTSIVR